MELDRHRADAAQDHIQYILKSGIEETRIAHQSCSLLVLNPPYDEATLEEDAETKTERQEKAFLRLTVPYFVPGGVLVYMIPQDSPEQSFYTATGIPLREYPDLPLSRS